MKDRLKVGIIIPAYNESLSIGRVVHAVSKYGLAIVVDDGSTDDTSFQAKKYFAKVVVHKENYGYDSALESGFKMAAEMGLDYVITIDADGQHNPLLVEQFMEALDDGFDIVFGSRDKKQRFAEFVFGWLTFLRWGIRDPLCGMKAYRMSLYLARGYFDAYKSIGTDLAFFALKNNFNFKEISIVTNTRMNGKPRFGQGIRANLKIFRAMILGFFNPFICLSR
jgi:glycosyltransferase involved in cell wall biosynthesis